ncbi:hypothetical protein B0H14DRAFT_3526732 [Mycena olivaceomarginata]|nr:hypothetical protein B0H14DRAFT_3526732 [Mycena olivaceomarginata]
MGAVGDQYRATFGVGFQASNITKRQIPQARPSNPFDVHSFPPSFDPSSNKRTYGDPQSSSTPKVPSPIRYAETTHEGGFRTTVLPTSEGFSGRKTPAPDPTGNGGNGDGSSPPGRGGGGRTPPYTPGSPNSPSPGGGGGGGGDGGGVTVAAEEVDMEEDSAVLILELDPMAHLDHLEILDHQVHLEATGAAAVDPNRPIPPYGTIAPTIEPKLKLQDLPTWDGDHDTAIKYFWDVSQRAHLGGDIPQALGYWLGMRLTADSPVQIWYASLPGEQQATMRSHWILYLQAIKDMYLGRTWQRKMNRQYEVQRFRQKGHESETPQAFVARRTMWTRMLVISDNGGAGEVYHIMEKAPVSWGPILILENVPSTMVLYAKVVEHEAALVNAWKNEGGRGLNQENLVATLKSLGYSPDKPRYVHKQAHFYAAEEQDSQVLDPAGNEIEFGDSMEEGVLKQVYATLKERSRPPPVGGYPFPKEDGVVTKLGKLPPGPCRLCGSEKHWNRECPNYVVYSEGVKRNAKLVSVTEPTEEETMYQSAFSVLLNQTLSRSTENLDRLGEGSFFDEAALSVNHSELANPTDQPRMIRKGEAIGMVSDPVGYFDRPSSEESREKYQKAAEAISLIVRINLDREKEMKAHSDHQDMKNPNCALCFPEDLPDPPKASANHPDLQKDTATEQKEERQEELEAEDYGPKTAAMPDSDDLDSRKLRELIDVGSIPDHLKEKAWEMLEEE